MPKHLSTALKLGVTLLGLWLVFRSVPFSDVWGRMQRARWDWLLLAFALMMASLLLRALRWQLLLAGAGAHVSFGRLVILYFVGNFFNAFLPSGFGGDVVRAIEASDDVAAELAAGTVIVDRLTGLMALFGMALAALPLRPATFPPELARLVAAISVVGLAGGFAALDGRPIRWLEQRVAAVGSDWLPLRLIRNHILPIFVTVQGCGWRAVWRALGISLWFNLMLAAWWWATGQALGLDILFGYLLLVVPLFSLALLVPSFSGLGVREVLAPILLAGADVSAENAIALSLTVLVLLRITSLVGGGVYLWQSLRPAPLS